MYHISLSNANGNRSLLVAYDDDSFVNTYNLNKQLEAIMDSHWTVPYSFDGQHGFIVAASCHIADDASYGDVAVAMVDIENLLLAHRKDK